VSSVVGIGENNYVGQLRLAHRRHTPSANWPLLAWNRLRGEAATRAVLPRLPILHPLRPGLPARSPYLTPSATYARQRERLRDLGSFQRCGFSDGFPTAVVGRQAQRDQYLDDAAKPAGGDSYNASGAVPRRCGARHQLHGATARTSLRQEAGMPVCRARRDASPTSPPSHPSVTRSASRRPKATLGLPVEPDHLPAWQGRQRRGTNAPF